ncbi:hypothetical protein KBK24_0121530 [Burkholderia sp. K24]|nr:hypothetical protein KBK24_0121530 [Burkholderia sp. K24]
MTTQEASVAILPIASIRRSPTNPRKRFSESAHAEMTASVRRHGVMQPVLLRPWPDEPGLFELVAGERRYRAAEAAGLAEMPALVKDLSDDEVLHIQIIENLQRKDLHPLEEADGYKVLADRGHTLEQIAEEVSQTKSYVAQRLKLCALTDSNRKLFFDEKLTATTALMIARLPVDVQETAAKEITAPYIDGEPRSAKMASQHIQRTYMLRLDEASFKTSDANLVPAAGACGPCPKRTGNQPDLFGDVKSKEVCTDPACYAQKRAAAAAQKRAEAEAAGRKVITGKEAKQILPSQWSSAQNGYVKLDDTCYDDPKRRSFRQILGAKGVKTAAIVESPVDGKLIDVMPKSDLKKALADKGIQASAVSSSNPSQSAELAKKKKADAYRGELFRQVRAKHEGYGLNDFDLKIVAVTFYRRLWNENQKRLTKLYGWGPKAISEADFAKKVDAIAESRDDPDGLGRLVMDIALIGESVSETYSSNKPELLEATARERGLDPAAIKKQLDAASKEKAKPKTNGVDSKKTHAKIPVKQIPGLKKPPVTKPVKPAPPKEVPAKKVVAKKAARKVAAKPKGAPLSAEEMGKVAWPFPTGSRP